MSVNIAIEDTMPMDDLVDSGEQGNNLYSILDQECLLEVFDEITTNYPDQGNALGNISNPGSPTGDSVQHNTSSMNGQFVSNVLILNNIFWHAKETQPPIFGMTTGCRTVLMFCWAVKLPSMMIKWVLQPLPILPHTITLPPPSLSYSTMPISV